MDEVICMKGEVITNKINPSFLNKFGVEKVEYNDGKVIFHMEDTYYFEVWILDFEIEYMLKHFPSATLEQIVISDFDFNKIYKYIERKD